MSSFVLLAAWLWWQAPEAALAPRPWLLPAWNRRDKQLLFVREEWSGDALWLRSLGADVAARTAPLSQAQQLWAQPGLVIDEQRWLGAHSALVKAHYPGRAAALWVLRWNDVTARTDASSPTLNLTLSGHVQVTALSPSDWLEGQRRGAQIVDARDDGQVLFSLDRRAPYQADLYRWQPDMAQARVAEVNPGTVLSWRVDAQGTPRLRQSYRLQAGQPSYRWEWRQEAYGAWASLGEWDLDQPAWRPLRFADSDSLWVSAETVRRDTHALHRLSLLAGAMSAPEIASSTADLAQVWWSASAQQAALVEWSSLLPHQRALLPRWQGWQAQVRALDPSAHWLFRQLDEASEQSLVTRIDGQQPQSWWWYQADGGIAERLGAEWPAATAPVPAVRVLRWDSPSGEEQELSLSAYYQGPETHQAAPLLVLVHGGPWARDQFQYDPLSARLAQLGIGVLKVNFRGSTGLGRDFLLASRGEWGGAMQRDLLEGIAQVVGRGWADPERVCIGGMSYGGYAALQSVLSQPQRFRCALAHAAVTDLAQHIAWLEQRGDLLGAAEWRAMVGDPRHEQARLTQVSPRSHAAQLRRPVFLSHARDDGVVAPLHSLQFLAQAPPQWVHWQTIDGGHALEQAYQRQQLWAAWIRFLQAQLLNPALD